MIDAAYLVKNPGGKFIYNTLGKTAAESRSRFCSDAIRSWDEYERRGYRCERVNVTEYDVGTILEEREAWRARAIQAEERVNNATTALVRCYPE